MRPESLSFRSLRVEYLQSQTRASATGIWIDEELWQEIDRRLFAKRDDLPQECLSIEDFSKQFSLIEYEVARLLALKSLARRNLSSFELKRLLTQRLIGEATVKRVVGECVNQGLINDQDWIDALVRGEIRRGKAARFIEAKLRFKGVPPPLIATALVLLKEQTSPREQILALLKGKWKGRNLYDEKERKRIIAACIRRGFSYEDIKTVMDETGS